MYKINFERLQEVEQKYEKNIIASNTLQKMMDIMLDSMSILSPTEKTSELVLETLLDLDIIEKIK